MKPAHPSLRTSPAIYISLIAIILLFSIGISRAQDLPIYTDNLRDQNELKGYRIRNLIDVAQIPAGISNSMASLALDLSHIQTLLDGTPIDPRQIYGRAAIGPYPFESHEASFAYKRFRQGALLSGGRGTLDTSVFFEPKYNSENWTDAGQIMVRLVLYLAKEGPDRHLGIYDVPIAFHKVGYQYTKDPWLLEGPFVNRIDSQTPDQATVTLTTPGSIDAELTLDDGRTFTSSQTQTHQFTITDLTPARTYFYRIRIGRHETPPYELQAAPPPGEGSVVFAYSGDSREGVGAGLENYLGANYRTIERLAALAYAKEAAFFLFGGDLINGYTTVPEDFRTQLYGWKQAINGFWHERPVYPGMGNHDALLKAYRFEGQTVRLDRWPYETESAEAVFRTAFANPINGPKPSDPRRPPYEGNVFSFQYGPVKVIAFNNNYWYTNHATQYGGCPEGYILDDQLTWMENQIQEAEQNPTVRYVVLFAQEPVFPCGGHPQDAMWYNGDNGIRAYTYRNNMMRPEPQGILDVRNRLVRAVANASKVAAVLGGDEHAYYRIQINADTPVGDPKTDDTDQSGRIDWDDGEPVSPLKDLKNPTWYITSGGGGAPYYAEEALPWNTYWKKQPDGHAGYYYSSQENVLIFSADDDGIAMRVYNPYGELIDEIPNLMAIKK